MKTRRFPTRWRTRTAIAVAGVVVAGTAIAGLSSAWAETNLAAGKPATGSASCKQNEAPAAAVNGSVSKGRSDKWCSIAPGTAFLQVDLQQPAKVGRFVVRHAGSGGESRRWNTRDFAISVSTDGSVFTPVVQVAGNSKDVTEHAVAATSARFVRLNVITPTSNGDRAARIYELEVYGATKPGPSPTASTVPPPSPSPKPSSPPPSTTCHSDAVPNLTDYISDHRDAMTRMTCNADVAIYFDNDLKALPASGTNWVAPFTTDVWKHIKATYGKCAVDRQLPAPIGPNCANFGAPKPALAFFHQGKHGGGTVANRFDNFSGFRTTLDVGDTGWKESNGTLHDEIVHEACHQAEGASQGTHESPAFQVWGDSKWAEFCVYDFYARTGRPADADRVLKEFTGSRDDLPNGARDAAWFRDWFLPLWKDSGNNGEVMQRFFGLLAEYFPTRRENGDKNLIYTRRMNAGEFVHFSSAAAGKDLSARAAAAFNSGFNKAEFEKAKKDFPALKY